MPPPRPSPAALATTAVASALCIAGWLALAVGGGVAAAAIFPTARGLDLSMPEYARFLAAEPALGNAMVAGHLAEGVFELTATLRVGAAAATAVVVAGFVAVRGRRPATVLTLLALLAASSAMAAGVWWLQPAFRAQDARYREAATSGEVATALERKAEVDAAHEAASRAAGTEALALLALLGLVVAAAKPTPRRAPGGDDATADSADHPDRESTRA